VKQTDWTPSELATIAKYELTPRELEVLDELANYGTVWQVAENLLISESTVRVHLTNAARKLGTSGEGQLATVLAAQRLGIITPF
jgi:DNA-binding CsgD family transcriptional regulator